MFAFQAAAPLRSAIGAGTRRVLCTASRPHACAAAAGSAKVARSTRPLFPAGLVVAEVAAVPAAERAAFKARHVNDEKLAWDGAEARARVARSRDLQYTRWRWACANIATYVNMLRACGHPDAKIQAMLAGTPMCFARPEDYRALRVALRELARDIEKEMGWANVNFVITGSSVPGFSQNPIKGFADTPSKITSATKSDVDISIVADGVDDTMQARIVAGLPEPARQFDTTCTASMSATRFGVNDLSAVCKAADRFYAEWSERLPGGLQLTFSENKNPIPPWEALIDTTNVELC